LVNDTLWRGIRWQQMKIERGEELSARDELENENEEGS